jgi:hypothetical protein
MIRSRVFLIAMLCLLAGTASAQQRDPLLQVLEGVWKGTMEAGGVTRPCEAVYAFALDGAFLEGTQKVFKDASKRVVLSEERIYVKSAAESGVAVNTFSSTGVSRWGTWTGAAKSWTGELQGSDGSRIALIIEFSDGTHMLRTGTLFGSDGELAEVVTVRLEKK